jgi:hypothetical protein
MLKLTGLTGKHRDSRSWGVVPRKCPAGRPVSTLDSDNLQRCSGPQSHTQASSLRQTPSCSTSGRPRPVHGEMGLQTRESRCLACHYSPLHGMASEAPQVTRQGEWLDETDAIVRQTTSCSMSSFALQRALAPHTLKPQACLQLQPRMRDFMSGSIAGNLTR